MDRPEYIKCITAGGRGITHSLCGRIEGWMFLDLEHAQLTVEQEGSQVPCKDCVEIASTPRGTNSFEKALNAIQIPEDRENPST